MAKLEKLTKAQLVETVRSLTQELKSLKKEKAKTAADPSDLNLNAVSLVQVSSGDFKLVKLKYDLETGVGKVESLEDYTTQYRVKFEATKYLAEKVMNQKLEVK